jgi:hypothetical protein
MGVMIFKDLKLERDCQYSPSKAAESSTFFSAMSLLRSDVMIFASLLTGKTWP